MSGLFAGGSAQVAAKEAEQAAANAEAGRGRRPTAAPAPSADEEAATLARAEATLQAARIAAVDPVEP